jgi:hypothetical protein
LQIADESGFDAEIVTDAQGRQKVQINGEAVNRARLRVDTRLKLLAKWNPKRYGDKIETHLSGDVGVKHTADPQAITSLASSLRAAARKPEAPKEDGSEFV